MKLYMDGITRNTENPNVISELKKAGYKEVIEAVEEKTAEKEAPKGKQVNKAKPTGEAGEEKEADHG